MHAVFPNIEPHGDVYAYISQWFVHQFPQFNLPFVPYIVRVAPTTENLRAQLHIPDDAIVFGRHGGDQSFNVPCAQTAVKEVAQAHPEIYFLFLNTQEFCHLPNVIFLPKTTDMLYKAKFINTCDAMIHARWRGETFGLACAEFSIKNKPVITWTGARERAHIEMLGDKARYYANKEELVAILTSFKKEPEKNWDAYSTLYSPEVVMQQFDAVFIQPLITHKRTHQPHQQITFTMPRLANGSINQDFIDHITTVFGCDVVIKEGGNLWQCVDHALTLHKRALLFFDSHWRARNEQRNEYAPSLIAELTRLKQAMNTQTVLIIDGIHYLDNSSFESAYRLIHEHGYQIYIACDTLLAFKDADVFVDPVIKAMTLIRLCEIADFAQDKKISELLAAEQIVGRALAQHPHQAHFTPAPSYATRYYQLFEGLACLHQKEYRTAAHHFYSILNCGYTHWRIYWYLGQALYKMGDIRSEDAMLHVLQACPQFEGIIDFKKAINA